jgi:hypothetical protein
MHATPEMGGALEGAAGEKERPATMAAAAKRAILAAHIV